MLRTYYHFMTLKHLTGSTADTYLEYVQRNLPEGVSMKVRLAVYQVSLTPCVQVIRHEVRRLLPDLSQPPTDQDH